MPTSEVQRIEQLESQVNALRRALAESEFLRHELKPMLEEYLESSFLLKHAKWALSTVVAFGIAIWLGGAFYGLQQVRTLKDEAADGVKQMKEEIAAQTSDVQKAAAKAKETIAEQEREAREKLATDTLPDLRAIRKEINKLNSQLAIVRVHRGKLNLETLSLLAGYSVIVLFAIAVASLGSSIWALITARSRKRS